MVCRPQFISQLSKQRCGRWDLISVDRRHNLPVDEKPDAVATRGNLQFHLLRPPIRWSIINHQVIYFHLIRKKTKEVEIGLQRFGACYFVTVATQCRNRRINNTDFVCGGNSGFGADVVELPRHFKSRFFFASKSALFSKGLT